MGRIKCESLLGVKGLTNIKICSTPKEKYRDEYEEYEY